MSRCDAHLPRSPQKFPKRDLLTLGGEMLSVEVTVNVEVAEKRVFESRL